MLTPTGITLSEYNSALLNERATHIRVVFPVQNVTFTDDDISANGGISLLQVLNTETDLTMGNAVSGQITINFLNNGQFVGMDWTEEFRVDLGVDVNGTTDWVTIGYFKGQRPDRVARVETIVFTARDRMQKFDLLADDFVDSLTFPMTMAQVYSALCTYVGIQSIQGNEIANLMALSYAENPFRKGLTCRQILAWIAEANCCYAKIDNNGKVKLTWFTDHTSDYSIDGDSYYNIELAEISTSAPDSVRIASTDTDGVSLLYPLTGVETYQIIDNPFLLHIEYSDKVAFITELLTRFGNIIPYIPTNLNAVGNWMVETGDIIEVGYDNGSTMSMPIFARTMQWNGGCEDVYECSGQDKRSEMTESARVTYEEGGKLAQKYTVRSGIDITDDGIEIAGSKYIKINSGGKLIVMSGNLIVDENGDVTINGGGTFTGKLKVDDIEFAEYSKQDSSVISGIYAQKPDRTPTTTQPANGGIHMKASRRFYDDTSENYWLHFEYKPRIGSGSSPTIYSNAGSSLGTGENYFYDGHIENIYGHDNSLKLYAGTASSGGYNYAGLHFSTSNLGNTNARLDIAPKAYNNGSVVPIASYLGSSYDQFEVGYFKSIYLDGEQLNLYKTGYTTSGKNYAIQVDPNTRNLYVNVPWTDTDKSDKTTVVKQISRGYDFDPIQSGYFAGMTKQTGIESKWWHILSMDWTGNDSNNWLSQLALPTSDSTTKSVYFRYRNGGTSSAWIRLVNADEAIKNITRSGTTFTATRADGTTFTFDQQDTNTWRPVQDNLTSTSTTESLSAKQGKVLNDAKVSKSGDTMTGQLKTSYRDSVAMGSYEVAAHTVPALVEEVRYSSGCAGSVQITTAYSDIPAGWYNFVYMPHRSGGVNGAASVDNHLFGNLLLCGMTVASNAHLIRVSSGAIAEVSRNLYADNNTWRGFQTKKYSYSWSGSCTNGSVVNVTAANFGKTAISGYTPVGIVQIHNAAGFVCNDIDITLNSGNVARFRNVSGSTITSGNFEITVLYLQN